MRILVDTNVLLRMASRRHAQADSAQAAIEILMLSGHELRIVPQVLYEYASVATRPASENGLGLPVERVCDDMEQLKSVFGVLRDERGILEPWLSLCVSHSVSGKQVHDARLVAAMMRHGLTHLLTFNVAHFKRYQEIEVLDAATTSSSTP